MINVVVIEDNEEVLQAYREILSTHSDINVLCTFTNCEDALKDLDDCLPHVVLMDLKLPGMSGIEGTRLIKQQHPQVNIIVVTVHSESEKVFEALCAGASGYITKDTDTSHLIQAIQEIQRGGAPMSSQIARMVVGSFQRNYETPLTKRETEVLEKLATGKTTTVIADELFLSKETVRSHVKNIYIKLQSNSKAEAIEKARKNRLI